MEKVVWLDSELDKATLHSLKNFLRRETISLYRVNIEYPLWDTEGFDLIWAVKREFNARVIAGNIPANTAAAIAVYNTLLHTPGEDAPIPFVLPVWQGGKVHHWEWL